jgi:mevalonate kinase
MQKPLHLLIVNCGEKKKGTAALVEQVRELKERFAITEELFHAYESIFNEFKNALRKGDLEYVGYLMDVDHGLLNALGLSTANIEKARDILKDLGALGSKITGAGGGGNIITLFMNEENALRAKLYLKKYGFESFYFVIN